MTLKDAKLKVGDRFRYTKWENVWEVKEIVQRGVLCDLYNLKVLGAHKHLCEWHEDIIKIS